MRDEQDVYSVFRQEGFSDLHEIVHVARFCDPSREQYVYINRDRLPGCIHVYVHPELGDPEIPGAEVVGNNSVAGRSLQFSSNLTKFPKQMHRGQTECRYGKGIVVDNLAALADLLRWVRAQPREGETQIRRAGGSSEV